MSDAIEGTRRRREAALRQIASLRRTRALARRKQKLNREINGLRTNLITLNSELSIINGALTIANARLVTDRQRMQSARQRATLETTLLTREQLQGNPGDARERSQRHYYEYRNTNPSDRDGITSRYDDYSRLHNAIIANSEQRVRPLIVESDNALQSLLANEEIVIDLNGRQGSLIQEIADLEEQLNELLRQDRELNRAHGKKRKPHLTRKKGTKAKRGGAWSLKYKKSINCKRPRGFSQKQYCKYGKKV